MKECFQESRIPGPGFLYLKAIQYSINRKLSIAISIFTEETIFKVLDSGSALLIN
jgi:hypothetical protein